MAKKREEMTADERREQETLEANVAREEKAELSVAERVSAAIPPNEPAELTAAEQFLKEAREAQGVFSAGNPISPDVLKGLVNRAVGLIEAHEADQQPDTTATRLR